MAHKRENIRDAISAILRDHASSFVLSTDEVADKLQEALPHPGRSASDTPLRWAGWTVYPHLRILEARGMCGRVYVDGQRKVFWMWHGPMPDAEVEELEAMWNATSETTQDDR